VCYCIRCTVLVVGFEQCSHPTTQRPTTATNHIQQNHHSTPYAVTHGLCSPEDGHNDARNMLRQKLIINIWLLHLVGFSLSSHFAHNARSQEPKANFIAFFNFFEQILGLLIHTFINSRLGTSSDVIEREITRLWQPGLIHYIKDYSNKKRTKYYKSDVWLTVHRNSVWIRKTN